MLDRRGISFAATSSPTPGDSVSITIAEIDHVVLRVADLARSITFYCDVLG